MKTVRLAACVVLLSGAAPAEQERERTFNEVVRPFLASHCVKCHGETKPKGGVRLDRIGKNLSAGEDAAVWNRILDQVRSGEMPPDTEPKLKPADVQAVSAWIDAGLREAERTAPGRGTTTAVRRLNSREYDNTIRDLFGMDCKPARGFPEESRGHGFDTVGSALAISPLLLEKYLAAAEEVVRRVFPSDRPALFKERIDGGAAIARKGDGAIGQIWQLSHRGAPNSPPWFIQSKGNPFKAPTAGLYVVRLRAEAIGQKTGSPLLPRSLVYVPEHLKTVPYGDEHPRLAFSRGNDPLGRIEVTPGAKDYEFRSWLEAGQSVSFYFENGPQSVRTSIPQIQAEYLSHGPGVALHWVEIEGPLFDSWPPSSVQGVFSRGADAREILRRFAGRAYRRPARNEEAATLLKIFELARKEGKTFEASIGAAIRTALCSPSFLYLAQPAAPGGSRSLDAYELASRISYFLWSSMPDEALLARAADGSLLKDAKVVEAEVRRMLKDPKSKALTQGFLRQWLRLGMLDAVAVDKMIYRDFDDHLRTSFAQETEAFFEEILHRDLSILNFIDSDFAMLNERLAKQYGIDGVKGMELRPVPLKEGSHRGGLLGQGAILTMTTCGTRTSPVMRGAWVLETILGAHPPPPPADVPDLTPDTRGIQTLRERLQKHREDPSCARCHNKIDPLGFALENYDVVGAWRETMGGSRRGTKPGAPEPPKGNVIDAGGQLAGGEKFRGPDEFRRALLAKKADFCRSLAEKLMIYALGRGTEFGDRSTLEALTRGLERDGYKLSNLIVELVKSEPFRNH